MKFLDLPEECPQCGHGFSTLVRPPRKMQKKAIALFLAGIVLTIPWSLVVGPLIGMIGLPANIPTMLLFAVIIFGPGIVVGLVAFNMRKVITLVCRECNWKERFLIDNRG